MAKIAELRNHGCPRRAFIFTCPGCGEHHIFQERWKDGSRAWNWNGDFEKPTVNPSILVTWKLPDRTNVCHSFIKDGRIQFLNDCTHHLAGQTVDLPDWED